MREWLDRAPTSNPVDRLNARFIQLLMIGVGLATVLARVYFTLAEPAVALPATWSLDQLTDLIVDGAVTLAAFGGVMVIRRGHFNRGIQFFLCVFLLSLAANYATTGYRHAPPDPTPTLLLAIGGVVLGRRTLWAVYTAVIGSFALGQLADATWLPEPRPLGDAFHTLPMLAVAYLLVTFAIDSTTRALRTMLAEAQHRSAALALANERLKKEMEERLRTQHQLIHSQKLDAVGRAATGVAHDFGNVLNVVLGYAAQREQLADLGTPALLDAMEGIELAALRALTLSRKLLNFSRQDVSVTQVFDATVALRELEPMLRQLLGRYIQLDTKLGNSTLPVLLDRGQFELMVLNIAANARDAMPEGGRFGVTLERMETEPSLLLTLADTGVGMTDDVRAHVFEPFYTTKPFGRGTGLGLAVVASMIEAAHGRIDVASAPQHGTSFHIRLPLHMTSDDTPQLAAVIEAPASAVAGE
ncbi:sensor histidine kinase [Dyella soli]|uniref:histidine kinase n=1 Tax=Dyella soli TaxID=522319 RepID=A0A4V2NKS9_9GAMM|nr:ATP-binding protein [Dyella soli]TCI05836.1 histidine kinase [Dyella soli]